MHFGRRLEAELEKAVSPGKSKKPMSEAQINAKIQKTLTLWLGEQDVKKRFRDPMARFNKEP